MSSDSDEPLSALKKAPLSPKSPDPDFEEKKPRKRKKKAKKLKVVLRPANDGRNVRYYASQSEVERPQDVWLYMKDLNPAGPYSCLLCTEWFLNKTKLVVHYVLNHKKDYCGICRYFVDNREAWIVHSKYHIPVTCSQCPERFPSDVELRVHFAKEHTSVHCRFCSFMMPEDQYHQHLFQRHNITNVANKDLPVLWDTEYEGNPKFSCALCLKSGTASIDFVKHYMAVHRFTLKCFAVLLSGFDVPFSVYGANISNSFLETALKEHAKVGYVERDKGVAAQKSLQDAERVEANTNLLQVLYPDIKQEITSDGEERVEVMDPTAEDDINKPDDEALPEKITKNAKPEDPIMSYKGTEDFDITLTELIIMNKSYIDYLNIAITSVEPNVVPVESKIIYNAPTDAETELTCSLCPCQYPNIQSLCHHMVKMHCVKTVPNYFCRLCVATFDSEAEFRSHSAEELADFDDLWLCQFCDMEFDGRDSARKHLGEHWSELSIDNCFSPHLGFKCRYCPTLFWNELDREGHQNRVHFAKHKEDFYKCNECLKTFSDKTWFVHHFRRDHDPTQPPYMMKCNVCCRVFTTVEEIKEHFNANHPEAKKIFCSLGTCKFKPFSQSKSFKMHLQTFHGRNAKPQEGAACIVCAREFPSARACSSHMALAHGPGRFKCKICGETLNSNDERKLHFMLQHPGRHPFECSVCGKSFQCKSSLYMHRADHHAPGQQDYTCKYCGKQFLKKDSFREHVLIHEGPRHTCSYCPMHFVQRSNMLRHERRHTGERPYTCPHCGRAFSDKGACNSHMRIHSPHEVHPCPYCGRTFAMKTKLRYHIRRHTGENLETCHLCSKLFTSVYALREHMKTHDKGQKLQPSRYLPRHVLTMNPNQQDLYTCPICRTATAGIMSLRYHIMTHSKIKHMQCLICNRAYSCRKTIVKHLLQKHGAKGPSDTTRTLYTELDPRLCKLGIDDETITNIFGPRTQFDTDVVVGDYVTFPKDVPVKTHDSDQNEEEGNTYEKELADEGNSESAAEEQPVSEEVLKRKRKISYEYEEISPGRKKRKKHKKKKKKKASKRRNRSSGDETADEALNYTEPTDFVTVKLEPTEEED